MKEKLIKTFKNEEVRVNLIEFVKGERVYYRVDVYEYALEKLFKGGISYTGMNGALRAFERAC